MDKAEARRVFIRKMLAIGIPVVVQNLVGIGLNLIDTLMIGKLGEAELAAVGAANQIYFVFTVTLFGLFSGAAVYTAQYWGAKDIPSLKRIVGIDYAVCVSFAGVLTVASLLFAPQIIRLFSKDPAVIGYGAQYLRI
nr:MATE family efflux transporter [Clostridia bacterium]